MLNHNFKLQARNPES